MFRCCLGSLLWRQCGWCERNRNGNWGLSTYIRINKLAFYCSYLLPMRPKRWHPWCSYTSREEWRLSATELAPDLGLRRFALRTAQKVLLTICSNFWYFSHVSLFLFRTGFVPFIEEARKVSDLRPKPRISRSRCCFSEQGTRQKTSLVTKTKQKC